MFMFPISECRWLYNLSSTVCIDGLSGIHKWLGPIQAVSTHRHTSSLYSNEWEEVASMTSHQNSRVRGKSIQREGTFRCPTWPAFRSCLFHLLRLENLEICTSWPQFLGHLTFCTLAVLLPTDWARS